MLPVDTDQPGSRMPALRIVPALVSVLLLVAGCAAESGADSGEPAATAGGEERVTVVATMTVLAEFAERVGGDHVTVTSLVPVGGDPHTYEPVPGDVATIAEADLVIDNGLGLSPWFEALAVNVEGRLLVLAEEFEDRADTDRDGRPDPHFWMSPAYAAEYVDAIGEELATLDPDRADSYEDRARAYQDRLASLDADLRDTLEAVPPEQRHLITHEDAYGYFADHYDLDVAGSLLGATTEEEPSARQLRRLVELTRERGIAAVFPQATENPSVMRQLARDAGAELGDELRVDSLGEPGSDTDTYEGLMRANAAAIADALGGSRDG